MVGARLLVTAQQVALYVVWNPVAFRKVVLCLLWANHARPFWCTSTQHDHGMLGALLANIRIKVVGCQQMQ